MSKEIDYDALVVAWNDLKANPTRDDVAKALGITPAALKGRAERYRRKHPDALINRHNTLKQQAENLQHSKRITSAVKHEPRHADAIYVVTSVQNNQNPDPAFQTLKNYVSQRKAQLYCIPFRYKTKSVFDQDEEWYASAFLPHILDEDVEIAGGKGVIMGSAKIQATAVNPTNRFESQYGHSWLFLGHPQVQMRVTPTANQTTPKLVYSSGAMTQKDYREGTAGKAGEFHHSVSATVIEVVGDEMHVRQLHADDKGRIYDLDKLYTPRKVEYYDQVAAVVTGDEHEMFHSPHVRAHTYGVGGIVRRLKPRFTVRHDVLDFWSRNHHHEKDPIINYVKHHSGTNSVEQELDQCVAFLDETTPDTGGWFEQNLIVPSNHPEALRKWLFRADVHMDPENALIYHKLWTVMLQRARMTNSGAETIDPFEWYVAETAEKEHRFLHRNEEFIIEGIDVSQHGDQGANGARGSITGLAKGANKLVIGHSHTPGINKGVYQVGHSTDGMNYASGHSGWMNTHCIIYPNGKRTLVNILPSGWCALEAIAA